jgi:hypothetical protein
MSLLMDMMARLALMEGIAGVPVGKWKNIQPLALGLEVAEEHFTSEGQYLDSEWFSTRSARLYKAIYFAALRILKDRDGAEELVQEILGGMSRAKTVEGGQLYDLGKRVLRQKPDFDYAIALMTKHTKQRAISRLRGQKEDSLTMDTEDGGQQVRDVPTAVDTDSVQDQIFEFLASAEGANVWNLLRQKLKIKWSRAPNKLTILDAIIENPNRKDTDIARNFGPKVPDNSPGSWIQGGAATYVSKIRREVKAEILDLIKTTPAILRRIEMDQELAQLGYGGSPMRWARYAKTLLRVIKSS